MKQTPSKLPKIRRHRVKHRHPRRSWFGRRRLAFRILAVALLATAVVEGILVCPALFKSAGHLLWDVRGPVLELLLTVTAVRMQHHRPSSAGAAVGRSE